jgi:hypothetical protein
MIIAENTFKMGYIASFLQFGSGLPNFLATGQPISRDDVPVTGSNSNTSPRQRAVRRITGASVTISSTTYTVIDNLTVSISRVGQIMFEYWLLYGSSAVGEGIGVQLGFNGVAAGIGYEVDANTDLATVAPLVVATAFDSGLAPYAAGPGASPVGIRIKGSCNVTTIGDLTLQVRAETGGANNVTALVGSWGFVNAIS